MTTVVPLTVTAKNEASTLGLTVRSLQTAMRVAEERLPIRIALLLVLDDCTDGTAGVARALGVEATTSSGGKIAAQRRGLRPGPFNLFCDADIEVEADVLAQLCQAMLATPEVQVAFPAKLPKPPRRRTPLAWALHVYNRRRGFSSQQHWFSGKLFAIRRWAVPDRGALGPRIAALGTDGFYDWEAGLRAEDVYLSREVLRVHGPPGLRETPGVLRFRAPETFEGMYRYYRRLRMELERTDALCPETAEIHRCHGTRRPDRLGSASWDERAANALFQVALWGCRARYRLERVYFRALASTPCDGWPRVEESKCP